VKFHKHIIPAIPWKKQDQTHDSFVILPGEISAYCIHGNAFCGRVKTLKTGRYYETSAKPAIRRSGVSAERRKPLEFEGFGFLPKAATLLLQRSHYGK
jgi:hypothetical protein